MKYLTVVFFATYEFASAQAVPLSLKQAVEIALAPDGNTRVRLAVMAVEQSKAREAQARGALLQRRKQQGRRVRKPRLSGQ